jgi:hypothetical protein
VMSLQVPLRSFARFPMMADQISSTTSSTDESSQVVLWVVGSLLLVATLLPASLYLQRDYHDFVVHLSFRLPQHSLNMSQLSLGPGGTPQTIPGYLRIKALSCFALRDRYLPRSTTHPRQHPSYLTSLPTRNRTRPQTRGIAPHRQTTQTITREVYCSLSTAISALATDNSDRLRVGTSCFERHNVALFSTSPARRTCRGEICHAHPSDGSMHLTLSAGDAKVVLEAGWGEWHPLACGVLGEKFVPSGFLLVCEYSCLVE